MVIEEMKCLNFIRSLSISFLLSSYCFICYKGKMQKFVFLETREAISSMLRPHWARRVDGKAHVILIQAQSDVLEVVPLGTSKGNGVKILLESLWASPNEVPNPVILLLPAQWLIRYTC